MSLVLMEQSKPLSVQIAQTVKMLYSCTLLNAKLNLKSSSLFNALMLCMNNPAFQLVTAEAIIKEILEVTAIINSSFM